MRNPLKLTPATDPTPTLAERLAATKRKARQVLAVNKALLAPLPKPAPEPDRIALVNYSTWLHHERRRVCDELYPHLGREGTNFILGLNAGEDWHFNGRDRRGGWTEKPPATARAVKILDMVGVEWRKDLTDSGRAHLDPASRHDTGDRSALPYGWPEIDTDLTAAVGNLMLVDAAISALGESDQDIEDVPGYEALDDARDDLLETLARIPAEGLPGLQAKARALLTQVVGEREEEVGSLARSLARNLIGASDQILKPRPDPVFAAIEETKRLHAAREAAMGLPLPPGSMDPSPEANAATDAFFAHVNGVLLKTPPATAAGCAALCRYALEFEEANDWTFDEDQSNNHNFRILDLVSRSQML